MAAPFSRPGGNCPLKQREPPRFLARTVVDRVMRARRDPSADLALASGRQVLAKIKGYAAWPAQVGRTPPLDLRPFAPVAGAPGDMVTVSCLLSAPPACAGLGCTTENRTRIDLGHTCHCHRARSDALTRHGRMASCCNLCRWSARTRTSCPRPSSGTAVARTPTSCSSSRPATCASRFLSAWRASTPPVSPELAHD